MAGKVQAPVARVELRKTQFIRVVARVTLFRVREGDRFDFRRKVQEGAPEAPMVHLLR